MSWIDNLSEELIDPDEANRLLATSPGNRDISDRHVFELSRHMLIGSWNPEIQDGVFLDTEGRLRNGHHTLMAIVMVGRPVRVFMRKNVPEELAPLMDFSRGRTRGDAVKMELGSLPGNAHKLLASMGRNALIYERGLLGKREGRGNYSWPLPSEVAAYVRAHVDAMLPIAEEARAYRRKAAIASAAYIYKVPIALAAAATARCEDNAPTAAGLFRDTMQILSFDPSVQA